MGKIKKNQFEKSAWLTETIICGVDEVGRGCLAGPVVTAAVILPVKLRSAHLPEDLRDSKEMTQLQRQKLYDWLVQRCLWSVAIIDHHSIDTYNIYQTTVRAMRRAVNQLHCMQPQLKTVLVDAVPFSIPGLEVISAPKGERWSYSIAAASVIAKVTRDNLMVQLDALVPGYYFSRHKGYATKLHKSCVAELKKSIIHRDSFL